MCINRAGREIQRNERINNSIAAAAALGIGGELIQPEALKSNKPEQIVEAPANSSKS